MERYDLVVVGAGSGGLGAAIAAARAGLSVLLVERSDGIGGTVARAWVNVWEPGVGGTGLPLELYRWLRSVPRAVGLYSFGRHFAWQDNWYWPHRLDRVNFPGGELRIDPARRYADTLRRHPGAGRKADEAFQREHWHGVAMEPSAYASAAGDLLRESGRCRLRLGAEPREARVRDGRIEAIVLDSGEAVAADAWVDATADDALCRLAGAELLCGVDPRSRFDEPDAPVEGRPAVNGVTLVYRIARAASEGVQPLPEGIAAGCWWAAHHPCMSCAELPGGDLLCNMLPTMDGAEALRAGPAAARAECERRVRSHWHFVQTHFAEFRRFRLAGTAPMLGVRESYRVVAERMLTEQDLLAGLAGQDRGRIVAIADHAMDRHGGGGARGGEVEQPYGIPFDALVPRGFSNLLVASRGAGFSSIAASSCRLSRTMMQLGQAAGTAAAIAAERRVDLRDAPLDALQRSLREQHVALEWPMPVELDAYVRGEGG